MSWDCPVFPIDAKNSIGFLVQFFLSYAPLVGDSVYKGTWTGGGRGLLAPETTSPQGGH